MAAAGREQGEERGPTPGVICSGAGMPEHSRAAWLVPAHHSPSLSFLPAEALRREQEPLVPSHEPLAPSYEPLAPSHEPLIPSHEPLVPSHEPLTPSHEPLSPSHEPLASCGFCDTFFSGTGKYYDPFSLTVVAPWLSELSCRQGPGRPFSCYIHC